MGSAKLRTESKVAVVGILAAGTSIFVVCPLVRSVAAQTSAVATSRFINPLLHNCRAKMYGAQVARHQYFAGNSAITAVSRRCRKYALFLRQNGSICAIGILHRLGA